METIAGELRAATMDMAAADAGAAAAPAGADRMASAPVGVINARTSQEPRPREDGMHQAMLGAIPHRPICARVKPSPPELDWPAA